MWSANDLMIANRAAPSGKWRCLTRPPASEARDGPGSVPAHENASPGDHEISALTPPTYPMCDGADQAVMRA